LYAWACQLGTIGTVGIEGTGAYGAGLCRWLQTRGVVVVEVERPDRKLRRNAGKADPIDAEAAARKVLSGEATVAVHSAHRRQVARAWLRACGLDPGIGDPILWQRTRKDDR
jgi:transposase